MKNKIICLYFVLIIMLSGCGIGVSTTESIPLESNNSQGEIMQTESIEEITEPDIEYTTEETQEPTSTTKEDVNIETIHMNTENMRPTILETSTIKVRLNKFSYANSETVFKLNFIVENDTEKEISVVLTDVVVNGYDVSTSVGKTLVEPGHKANCDSSVWQKEIDETGESEWAIIEGVIEIRDGYWGDALYSVPVIIEKGCWEYEEEYAKNNPITPIISSDLAEIPDDSIVISSENMYPTLIEQEGVSANVKSFGYANGKTVFKINFAIRKY